MLDANAMMMLRTVRGGDGHLYVLDPEFRFPNATHIHLPPHRRRPRQSRVDSSLAGLGITQLEAGAMGAATIALNFVPVVGPILSGIAALAGGLLSGGDPTPEWQLETQVMQLREQIALAHRQLGIADSFPIPLPDAKGPDHVPTLQAAVTEANGGPVASSDWRKGLYSAIHNLQAQLGAISQQTNDSQVAAQVLTALHQSPVLPAGDAAAVTPPDGTGSPPAAPGTPAPAQASMFGQDFAQAAPWAIGGVVMLTVLLMALQAAHHQEAARPAKK